LKNYRPTLQPNPLGILDKQVRALERQLPLRGATAS
jgi:hypothetical protein